MCVCGGGYMSVAVSGGQKRALHPLELELTGGCEPADMGTRSQTQVLCWSNTHSQPLSHLPSHRNRFYLKMNMKEIQVHVFKWVIDMIK